jgi:hypothetical protein
MEKIKDFSKVIVPAGAVLAEIFKPKRYIVAPDGTEDKDSYGVIMTKHLTVSDVEIGDIVIKYSGKMDGYTLNTGKSNERTFVIMYRNNMNIVVRPDNFIDPDKITEKVAV